MGEIYPDASGPLTVTTGYNLLGRPTQIAYPAIGDVPGFTVEYSYDALGHRDVVTDATGTTTYDYDALYQPLGIAAPTGAAHYTHNAAGQRANLVYPGGEVVTYTHDAAGRLHTVSDWAGGVTVYTYTAAGRLSGMQLPNGVTTQYGYDTAGRLVELAHRDESGGLLARYEYTLDGLGNRVVVTETVTEPEPEPGSPPPAPTGLTAIVLHPPKGAVLLSWHPRQPEAGVTYNVYRSWSVPVPLGAAQRIATGLEVGNYEDRKGGLGMYYVVTAENEWGESGPSNTARAESGEPEPPEPPYPPKDAMQDTGRRAYDRRAYDRAAQLTHTITYTYDPLNRLVAAAYSTGEQFAYGYDEVGNRTVLTDTKGIHVYEYDAANRLTSVDGVTYTWDARGNLTHDGTFTYTYNSAGRLVRAESITATLVYTYNAAGLRVAQSVDGDETEFSWDTALPLAQAMATSDGAIYIYGLDLIAQQQSNAWQYTLGDSLGSVR